MRKAPTKSLADAVRAARPTGVIMAGHYLAEAEALAADPIVQQMASEIPAGFDLDSLGVTQALHEYTRRGGKNAHSIGGVQWALKALVATRRAS